MAKLEMKDYTGSIMIEPPKNAWGLQTVKIKGAALYPGFPVTQTGEAVPEVVTPASADNVFYGILLDKPGNGVDELFTAGETATVMMNGSGGACWTYVLTGVATMFPGTRVHCDATTPTAYCIIGENMLYENVGLCIEYSATDAVNERPIKVVLSG